MKNKRQKGPLVDAVGGEWVERDSLILGYVTISQRLHRNSPWMWATKWEDVQETLSKTKESQALELLRNHSVEPGIVMYTFTHSTWEAEAEPCELQASLVYIVSSCVKRKRSPL